MLTGSGNDVNLAGISTIQNIAHTYFIDIVINLISNRHF